MKIKKSLNVIQDWDSKKTIAQNVGNQLCPSSQDINHQHSQGCFKNFGTKEESDALKTLFSDESLTHVGNAYLSRVVEPIFESLSSHNGSEPSLLYTLLQHAVRLSTDRLSIEVKSAQITLEHKKEKLARLVAENPISGLNDLDATYRALNTKENELTELQNQYEGINAAIQAQSVRNSKLPQGDDLSKMLSKSVAEELKKSYSVRVGAELDTKKGDYSLRMIEANSEATDLFEQQEKNTAMHQNLEAMKEVLFSVNEYVEEMKLDARPSGSGTLRFFSKGTAVKVNNEQSKKDFSWDGKKGLCENLRGLLNVYINTPGHSSDRLESANRIYDRAVSLLNGRKLTRLQRDEVILDEIRREKIASKGRWNGEKSQLFVIYRTAEFAHRENLRNFSNKVIVPELEDVDAKANGVIRLEKLMRDIEGLQVVMEESRKKLNELREQEIHLIMNAEHRNMDDDAKLMADAKFIETQNSRLKTLSENELSVDLCRFDILEKSQKSAQLKHDTAETKKSISVVYKRLSELSFLLRAQNKVALAPLPDIEGMPESAMLERATAYIVALKAEVQAQKKSGSEPQSEDVSNSPSVLK